MSKSGLLSTVRICELSCCLALLAPLVSSAQYEISEEDAIDTATKFAKHIVNGRFEKAGKYMGDETKTEMAQKLKEMFEKSTKSVGKFKSFSKATVDTLGDLKVVTIPTHFEHGFLNLNVLVNYQGEVEWIKYEGVGVGSEGGPSAADQPTESETKDVAFGTEPWQVKAKLTLPKSKKPVPVVVLVNGSGPHDEDGTIGPNKPFQELAEGFASQGIAALRYPNRAFAYKDKLSEQKTVSLREEMVDDVTEALKFLRKRKDIDKSKIYLLGFGFGGAITAQIAQDDKKIAGVILMASPSRNVADSIEAQLKYMASLPGPQQAEIKKQLDQSSSVISKLRDGSAPTDAQLLGQPISRWKEMNEYSTKSAAILAALDCRILVAGAGRDYQVTRADFDAYKKALKDRPNVKFKWYKPMNHYFARGEGKSSPEEYEKPAPVDKVVIEQLGKWTKADESSGK
jgi:uncharacterized protein